MLRYGFLGKMDFAIIEAVAIIEEGNIVSSTSLSNSPTFAKMAEKVMIEINLSQPLSLEGMDDVYPEAQLYRKPIPLVNVDV
ncbi:hypothetical protein [Calorimonas adulescens]|uniref:hypothetical protein n=1 Tax=Calorimonas adulescens TaxID=2606906 RepID=UPI001939AD0B